VKPTVKPTVSFLIGAASVVFPAVTFTVVAGLFLLWKKPAFRLPRSLISGAVLLLIAGALPQTSIAWQSGFQDLICVFIFWAAANMRRQITPFRGQAAAGMTTALVGMLMLTTLQVLLAPGTRPTGWLYEPNIWATSTLMPLAMVLFTMNRRGVIAIVAMLAAFGLIWLTGSRTALFALMPLMLVTLLAAVKGSTASRRVLIYCVVALAAVGGLLQIAPGFGSATSSRLLGLWSAVKETILPLPTSPAQGQVPNLLSMSELLLSDVWSRNGVALERTSSTVEPAEYLLEKISAEGFARVHQRVSLEANEPYTLSADFRIPESDWRSGFAATRVTSDDGPLLTFSAGFGPDGARVYSSVGVEVSAIHETVLDGGWTRLSVTFQVQPSVGSGVWRLGIAPDLMRRPSSAAVLIRAIQLERGRIATPYQATTIEHLNQRQAHQAARGRLAYWQSGLAGFLESPWFGQQTPFRDFHSNRLGVSTAGGLPDHSHNLLLQTLYQGGVLAGIGLVLLLFGAVSRIRLWTPVAVALMASLLILTTFDLTFWSQSVSYAAFALFGLHAGEGRTFGSS